MITTNLGSMSGRLAGFSSSWADELAAAVLRKEQARMINATAMSPSMRASPPKRYGIGVFQWWNPAVEAAAAVVVVVFAGLILYCDDPTTILSGFGCVCRTYGKKRLGIQYL